MRIVSIRCQELVNPLGSQSLARGSFQPVFSSSTIPQGYHSPYGVSRAVLLEYLCWEHGSQFWVSTPRIAKSLPDTSRLTLNNEDAGSWYELQPLG
jgi:hypothetical protein